MDRYILQMIWGCFVGDKLGSIAFIDGTINSDVYIEILFNNLVLYLDVLMEDSVTGIIFQ
jgi:hypothetical protein